MSDTAKSSDLETLASLIGQQFAKQFDAFSSGMEQRYDSFTGEMKQRYDSFTSEMKRNFEVFIEDTNEQNLVQQKHVDDIIDKRLSPLSKKIDAVVDQQAVQTTVLKVTNKELRQLDTAVGNVEHRVHNTQILATSRYVSDRKIRATFEDFDARLTKLEIPA